MQKLTLDDLLYEIKETMTALKNIETDINDKKPLMLKRYILEADKHLQLAKLIFEKIIS